MSDPITEAWLREVGFKWHQLERQPSKQWLLWLGGQTGCGDFEDIGVELAQTSVKDGWWHCWIRSDVSHRYGRFLHVRYLETRDELIRLVEGLTGHRWDPANHICGSAHIPSAAARIRAEHERLDLKMLREAPWPRVAEKDDSIGGALPEHLEAHEKAKQP